MDLRTVRFPAVLLATVTSFAIAVPVTGESDDEVCGQESSEVEGDLAVSDKHCTPASQYSPLSSGNGTTSTDMGL
jgi:hypothetical protein